MKHDVLVYCTDVDENDTNFSNNILPDKHLEKINVSLVLIVHPLDDLFITGLSTVQKHSW